MRRDEIVEVLEVKPLTVGDVLGDDDREPTAPAPSARPQPIRA